MATIRALVVDDEQLARDELCFLLRDVGDGEIDVVGQAANGIDALRLAGELQPDLIFLDVQMPGLTGFEVARKLLGAGQMRPIVFVTAFDQYWREAFAVSAFDYLLKPVDPAHLEQTLERVRKRLDEEAAKAPLFPADLERVIEAVQAKQGRRDQVAIRANDKYILIPASDISHVSVQDELLIVVTNTMSGTSNYRTLDELQARLDPSIFRRVHRSHLVNIKNIKEIVPWGRNFLLKMRDSRTTEIPVSRSQTKWLRDYLQL